MVKLKETQNIEAVFQVKGNQKHLLKACIVVTEKAPAYSRVVHKEKKAHNRIEKRTITVFPKGRHDLGTLWNSHLNMVIRVRRERRFFNTKKKQYHESAEVAYYLTTLKKLSAREGARIIRLHWGIENSNHYVRDVTLGEDASRIRKSPENFALIRSFGMNLMRVNGVKNVRQARYKNTMNIQRVLEYRGVKG